MKRYLLALVLLAYMPAAGDSDSNHFVSTVAGFEIRKPNSWHFTSSAEHLEQLKELKLEDDEFKQKMVERSRLPLVVLMKHPTSFEDLNPTLKVQFRPLGLAKDKPAVEILQQILPSFRSVFKNLRVVTRPEETELSGLPGAYAMLEYDLETEAGESFPTTSEIWIIPNGDFMFILGAGTRTDERTGSRDEIRSILKTVKIVPSAPGRSASFSLN